MIRIKAIAFKDPNKTSTDQINKEIENFGVLPIKAVPSKAIVENINPLMKSSFIASLL